MIDKTEPNKLLGEPLQLPPSLWATTAIRAPEPVSLGENHVAEVLIIGAGFTGLSAAIHLAEAGRSVVVVDAAEPGWGASGRNNGQVIAGLKLDPDEIERAYPGEAGRQWVRFGSNAPSVVFDLIDRYAIDCAASKAGWIQPAFTRRGIRAVRQRHEMWVQRGVAAKYLECKALSALLGTHHYSAGWIDPRGGSVQPLSYARGLARAAQQLGVALHYHTKVASLSKKANGHWEAKTPSGTFTAQQVVIATGAYADKLVPGLRTSIVPVRTAQVATKPLPLHMRRQILPKGHVSSDTRQLLTSFRLSPDGRLVMGGSGATAGLDHTHIVPYLHQAGQQLFGHLGPLEWEFHWSGYFAVTLDHLPHVHEPETGMYISLGCNGRGIAVSTALGIQLSKRTLGAPEGSLEVPITTMKSVPLHAYRQLGVAIATRYKRIEDALL